MPQQARLLFPLTHALSFPRSTLWQLLEKRWSYEQAKEREMAEVCEFMGVEPPPASSSRQQEKRDKLDKRKSKEERASAGSERDDALSEALDLF